jgi:hypothetical protein
VGQLGILVSDEGTAILGLHGVGLSGVKALYQTKAVLVHASLVVGADVDTSIAAGDSFLKSRVEANLSKVAAADASALNVTQLGGGVVLGNGRRAAVFQLKVTLKLSVFV